MSQYRFVFESGGGKGASLCLQEVGATQERGLDFGGALVAQHLGTSVLSILVQLLSLQSRMVKICENQVAGPLEVKELHLYLDFMRFCVFIYYCLSL